MSKPTRSSSPPTEESRLLDAPPDPIPPSVAEESDNDNEISKAITRPRAAALMASLALLTFLQATNFSLLTTTQSTIAADLDSFGETSWFTSAYLIAMASVSPLAGRLSQIFSPRYCVLVAAVTFAVGSLVTSQAKRLAIFLLGRAITGVGAAGCLNLTIILVVSLVSKRRRGLFFGLINTAVTTGVSLGAVLGGALLEPLGWRGLFWIQSPLTFVAGICVFLSLPASFTSASPDPTAERRPLREKLLQIDYSGAVLLTSTLVCLLFGLSAPQILWIPIGISFGLLVFFVLNEVFVASGPVIPVALLKSRGALLSCFSQLGAMMARWLVLFYTPVYALAVRGWTPASAGAILIPTNAGFAAGGLLAGVFHIKRAGSFYVATLVSFVFFPVTLFILSQLSTRNSNVVGVVISTFANGFATGAFLNYTLAHMLHLTRAEQHPIATSILGTFRGFAGSFGSAIGGGLFLRILKPSLEAGFRREGLKGREDLVRRLLGQPALVRQLEGIEKEIARQGYVDAIQGLFIAGVGLSTIMIFIQAGTGWKGAEEKFTIRDSEDEDP